MQKNRFRAGIITASDKGAAGEREDRSGALLKEMLEKAGYEVIKTELVADEEELIYEKMTMMSDEENIDIVFTTGGTGLSQRDCTPEATLRAATYNVPGIAEAIRQYSLSITPRAMFSRAVSVVRNQTLIINLPGSPKAVKETLEFLLPELAHGLAILTGSEGECGREA